MTLDKIILVSEEIQKYKGFQWVWYVKERVDLKENSKTVDLISN